MFVPQFSDDGDGMQSGVLSEGSGDDLKGFGESLKAVCFFAFECMRVLGKETGDVDFRGAAAGDQSPEKVKRYNREMR